MGAVEIIRFRLVADADHHAFIDADKRFETQFVYRRPGFVRRMLLRADDGAWVSHVLWRDRSDADAAWEQQVTSDQSCVQVSDRAAMIDGTTVNRELLTGHD